MKSDSEFERKGENPYESNSNEISQDIVDENLIIDEKNDDSKRNFIQRCKDFYWAMQPIFWTHHPMCKDYQNHTIKLFGRDLCIGCYVGMPAAILMLIIGYITGLFGVLSTKQISNIGLILMSAYGLSIIGLTEIKWIKIFSKILVGSGGSFIIAAIFSLPTYFIAKILLSFIFLQFTLFAINLIRFLKMKRHCKKCEYKQDWDNCPGFAPVLKKLSEKGFSKK